MFAVQKKKTQNLPEANIEAIREGDPKAFEELFRMHYASLSRYANSILKQEDEAEDVVQQVFINYWENRSKTIISGSLKGYLFRSVHNKCLNVIKHHKVRSAYVDHSLFYDNHYHLEVEENVEANELQSKIETAIQVLPEQCQKIFRMSRFEQLRHKEIAELLNISAKTVENQIGKALKIMRGSLKDYLVSFILIILGS
ncbi:RNA polymerase sigma-70 factor [Jiulongibacter sp. NS-SX5]|uniref:RNA polymerase sigma-70 factor n=1 Tax=Jiulongibacter sp. NS-SX5 TaxID=3463854 RepID=UPI00405876E8